MKLEIARQKAKELMKKHGLTDWTFRFGDYKPAAGKCHYGEKAISLSKEITENCNSDEEVIDTILHEIAHALCPNQGHNRVWKRKLIEIGGNGERCYSADSATYEAALKTAKYVGSCPNGHKSFRQRKLRVGSLVSCGKCSPGKFDKECLVIYKKQY